MGRWKKTKLYEFNPKKKGMISGKNKKGHWKKEIREILQVPNPFNEKYTEYYGLNKGQKAIEKEVKK